MNTRIEQESAEPAPKLHAVPPITGYRSLTQAEVDLINRIKAQGAALSALVGEVNAFIDAQAKQMSPYGEDTILYAQAEPVRWIELARTDFQTGLMALTRAVAQPTNF